MDDPPEQYLNGFDSTFWSLPPLILFFLLCSAMFSAGETAYFSLTKAQLDLLRTSASAGHRRILRHLSDPRRLLANLLIGNNVVNLTIILLFYFMFFKVLDFGPYPWIPAVLQTFVVTALIVFVGEVIPKVYASRNPLSVALWFSMPLQVSAWVFRPIIWVLINSTGLLDRWIVRKQTQLSKDEINQAIDLTFGQEQARSGSEKELLKGIVNFGELEVRQIMVPRLEIKALDSKSSLEEVLPLLRDWGYSRVPVFSESLDQIVGILYLKDLFTRLNQGRNFRWQELLRKPFVVPDTKHIDDLFREFKSRRMHMALAIDEYGGVSGLVTLEDILEQIVGEIQDEFDTDEQRLCRKIDTDQYWVAGKMLLQDLSRETGWDWSEFSEKLEGVETMAGLILELEGRIPAQGEVLLHRGFEFLVLQADARKIVSVHLKRNPHAANDFVA
ncbi:MAG: gliding motility-associated protein GldE [Bacteroidetes bacterium]|jgi:putative hemolysin|nr:gliding motility-associated protein GldE [Bacteroidota bacterium]